MEEVEAGIALSENENLLAEEPQPRRRLLTRAMLVPSVLLICGLVGWTVIGHTRSTPVAMPREVVELVSTGCFSAGVYYLPATMQGQSSKPAISAVQCQSRCAAVTGCEHFSYWPDGGCNLHDGSATYSQTPAKYADVISGPKFCGTGDANAVDSVACSAHQACVAGGMTSGNCCPNNNNVSLACCNPTQPAVVTVTQAPAAAAACKTHHRCVQQGLTKGACCPTAAGVAMDCCIDEDPGDQYINSVPVYNKSRARDIILGASSRTEALNQLDVAAFKDMKDDPVFDQCLKHLCIGCDKHPFDQMCNICKYQCPFRTWQCCTRTYCEGNRFGESCVDTCGTQPTPNC